MIMKEQKQTDRRLYCEKGQPCCFMSLKTGSLTMPYITNSGFTGEECSYCYQRWGETLGVKALLEG